MSCDRNEAATKIFTTMDTFYTSMQFGQLLILVFLVLIGTTIKLAEYYKASNVIKRFKASSEISRFLNKDGFVVTSYFAGCKYEDKLEIESYTDLNNNEVITYMKDFEGYKISKFEFVSLVTK